MPTRKILNEQEAKEWFQTFGKDIGKTFDDVFGKMSFEKTDPTGSVYKIDVIENILFIRIRNVIKDEFNYTPEIIVKDTFIISPQYWM